MRSTLTDFRAATATLRTLASQHPELRDDLLPIADLLNLHADVIALGHAVDEHGSLVAAKIAGDPRV